MSAHDVEHLDEGQLSDFVDGRLDDETHRAAAAHLEWCTRCAGDLRETRALIAWSRGLRDGVAAPPELWTLVNAATVHRAPVRRMVLRSMRPLLVAGALAVALATSLVTWSVARRVLVRPSTPAPAVGFPRSPVERERMALERERMARERERAARDRERVARDRERVARERAGRAPEAPRAPQPPAAPRP